MGFDYALVHLKYTIPPGIALTLLYRPFLNRLESYKIAFLISIAVISTIPWDSYLIRRKIWTYPSNVIIGPTLFDIPAEEIFFFVIQTYNTSLLYLILSKPVFHPNYLTKCAKSSAEWTGQIVLGLLVATGAALIWQGKDGTYLGLILAWAAPFVLLLWSLSSQFLTRLPYSSTVAPIAIPTFYLWIVDTIALRRGTWTIESGTKLGFHLWDGLEIEEAIFFLATNILIVFGQVAFDHALTILYTFLKLFPDAPQSPSPVMLVRALWTPISKYDEERMSGILQAVRRLQRHSRSFYLASATFSGRLKIDLILLYSFCRVADDLVDNAKTEGEAREWIKKLTKYLDLVYSSKEVRIVQKHPDTHQYITENFPKSTHSTLQLLPTHLLSYGPLYDLLKGFKTDLQFSEAELVKESKTFPIATEHDLETYSARVAGTVAELLLELVFHHTSSKVPPARRDYLVRSGGRMGVALQYVNIARDIVTDALISRVYIPTSWLEDEGLTPVMILSNPRGKEVDRLRSRLLEKAFGIYHEAQVAMELLPDEARAPMRVAVESYMEIGRVLAGKGYEVKAGKATVPKLRRLRVAWKALSEG